MIQLRETNLPGVETHPPLFLDPNDLSYSVTWLFEDRVFRGERWKQLLDRDFWKLPLLPRGINYQQNAGESDSRERTLIAFNPLYRLRGQLNLKLSPCKIGELLLGPTEYVLPLVLQQVVWSNVGLRHSP